MGGCITPSQPGKRIQIKRGGSVMNSRASSTVLQPNPNASVLNPNPTVSQPLTTSVSTVQMPPGTSIPHPSYLTQGNLPPITNNPNTSYLNSSIAEGANRMINTQGPIAPLNSGFVSAIDPNSRVQNVTITRRESFAIEPARALAIEPARAFSIRPAEVPFMTRTTSEMEKQYVAQQAANIIEIGNAQQSLRTSKVSNPHGGNVPPLEEVLRPFVQTIIRDPASINYTQLPLTRTQPSFSSSSGPSMPSLPSSQNMQPTQPIQRPQPQPTPQINRTLLDFDRKVFTGGVDPLHLPKFKYAFDLPMSPENHILTI